jgi:diacylglycerol kinase (ATP)
VKTLVICNPNAGGAGEYKTLSGKLRDALGAVVRVTKKKGDAARLARSAVAKGFDFIIAAGGDGTLNEVVNGIATKAGEVQVGLLPLGTGNDFARVLNLPSAIEDNIDILQARRTRSIDLVRVKSDRVRYFVNVSAGGFSGLVDEKLTPEIKRTWGPLAYVRSAAAALPNLHAYRTRVVLDGAERFSIDLYNVIVGNGRYVAGGLPVAPEADPSDGQLDVILISKRSTPELVVLAAQMLVGKHLSSEGVIFRRAAKISMRSRPGMWFNTDGEMIGNEPAVFQVIPGALNFVVGKQ